MSDRTTSKPKRKPKVNRDTEPGWRYHRLFAVKAAQEAGRVLAIFEKEHPEDDRPRVAIEAIQAWGDGVRTLGMVEVRRLALDAHAAAREAKTDAARFAARAAGQAVAVWHVPTHAMAVPMYVCKARHALTPKMKGKRTSVD
ncbi:putative immunity protein [Brevifollis gellanilyticus]|uniref:Imm-5-like domain-containing protein n=1 Tax=Brevifollis gellanilyticus TaxID=748831 RepID=A0A512MCR7_9BACT|nr:hypothetical protein [Brevifollis gellanilyticus]GEP44525.1 hypothetical protein BGE01nite_38160 [Brevifollis gellanilyticus]